MMGYLKNREATLDCMTPDGYFKTGDQGVLDKGGFLKITGRIKELIITAGGENVAPVPIEDNFKAECPVCSNIMLVGENRRFMSALITLKADMDMKTGLPSKTLLPETADFLKRTVGITVKTTTEACKSKELAAFVHKAIEATNAKAVSRAAHIKKFVLLDSDFSQPGGELTPTMKLKRKVTEQKYQAIVEGMYAAQAKL
jgi:long-chain-fatty-acid--CoA ligase ACSBG